MGVTLERVQFKFASIIGELCSEPDILSQFAVWVDLRLAEYKLKGSISLDCSGDLPDPIWLKGIVSALLYKRQLAKQKSAAQSFSPSRLGSNHARTSTARRPAASPSSHFKQDEEESVASERLRGPDITSPRNHGNNQPEEVRLSPDIVIKEEPTDDEIYPISLHVHERGSKDTVISGREGRKRTAAETITSEIESLQSGSHYQQHSPKLRRMEPNTAEDVQTSNESLMSIIGLGDHSQDSSSISVENINSDCDFILATEVAQNANQEMAQMGGNSSMQLTPQRASGSAGAAGSNSTGKLVRDPSTGNLTGSSPSVKWGRILVTAQRINRAAERYKMKTDRGIVLGTLMKTRGHVKIFHGWLRGEPYRSNQNIEDIPPEELDTILELFFSTIKTRNGTDYGPNSLKSLRDSLERHLKGHSYPASILTSPAFNLCRRAYRERINMLKGRLGSHP